MALYQHTWGLTDMRKSEYEIMIKADPITKAVYDSERQSSRTGRPLVGASRENTEEENIMVTQSSNLTSEIHKHLPATSITTSVDTPHDDI